MSVCFCVCARVCVCVCVCSGGVQRTINSELERTRRNRLVWKSKHCHRIALHVKVERFQTRMGKQREKLRLCYFSQRVFQRLSHGCLVTEHFHPHHHQQTHAYTQFTKQDSEKHSPDELFVRKLHVFVIRCRMSGSAGMNGGVCTCMYMCLDRV